MLHSKCFPGWGIAAVCSILLLTFALLALSPRMPAQAQSGTCYVRINDDPTEYATVQAAVDVAQPGDTVKVAGYCAGVESRAGKPQVVYINQTITVQGGYTTTNWTTPDPVANPTILDAQGQGRVIHIYAAGAPTIAGLHIINGNANNLGGGSCDAGGGIYSHGASPVIRENWISDNAAGTCDGIYVSQGGGIYADGDGSLTIISNTIRNNHASYAGGGIYTSGITAVIAGNIIINNHATDSMATFGGGIFLDGATTVTNNWIEGNGSNTEAGGIWSDGTLTLAHNSIYSNTSARGGGILVIMSTAYLENNVIAHNHANYLGGAIQVFHATIKSWHDTFIDNRDRYGAVIAFNTNAAPRGSIAMTNTVIVSSTVGFTATERATIILNSVLWHSVPMTVASHPSLTLAAQNQYYGDPAFAADGYHLTASSAALNRGVATDVTTDIDGEARPSGSAPDLGADELQQPTGLSRIIFLVCATR